ncbi:DUF5959 family protein [Streptomyces sp. NPDC002132]|uniref:DUF5959 family protein n=1 Tax=unclassified Streptomyces TaxID=2593676 RepID=UPI003326C936
MGATDGVIDLIHLADRPDAGGNSVAVRVLGRCRPGILTGHDFLDCEIVIAAELRVAARRRLMPSQREAAPEPCLKSVS